MVDAAAKRAGERLVGQTVQILCEGPSKTNRTRLTGRTRSNKIVVYEGNDADIGQLDRLENYALDWFQFVRSESGSGEQLSFGRDGRTFAACRDHLHDLSPFFAYRRFDRRCCCSPCSAWLAIFLPAHDFLPGFRDRGRPERRFSHLIWSGVFGCSRPWKWASFPIFGDRS